MVRPNSSGRGRIDDLECHPQGETRGQKRLVKITDVRKYAAEQGIAENETLEKGLKAKSAEFIERGSEVYANP